jgi:DNA-binding transcriptional LysR family regulator
MIDWSDFRLMLAVHREGTLTAAAKALAVNQSTVTRRLSALQQSLGARVLERRGASWLLTPLGERLLPLLAEMEDRALALERAAQGLDTRPAGVVRLTTVDALAVRFLAPALRRFREELPDVVLEVDSSARTLDLGRREADLALRLGRPRQETLVARRVGRVGFRLYASPGYLATHGQPRLGHGLAGHELIDDDDEQTWSVEVKWSRSLTAGARVAARMQTWQGRLAAVEAGAGIAVLPCFLGDASKLVRRLGKPSDILHHDLWLLVHRELRQVARIRVVYDFVIALVEKNAAAFEG